MEERRKPSMESAQLNSLKELILTKFSELEKRLELNNDNHDLKLDNEHCKNTEQDSRLDIHDTRLDLLETKDVGFVVTIKNSILSWIVPFIMGLLLLWAKSGFPTTP